MTTPRRTAKVTRLRPFRRLLSPSMPRTPPGVDAMCVKQPLATFEQKLEVSARQVPKRVYMLAAGWEPSPFQQFGARFKNDRGWQFVSFACGHDVMMDQPQELAAALIAAAQGGARKGAWWPPESGGETGLLFPRTMPRGPST